MYRIAPNSEMGYYDKIVLGSIHTLTKGMCIRYRHIRFDGKKVAERDCMSIPVTPTVIPSDGTIAGYLPAPADAKPEPGKDYTITGNVDGKQVVIAECHHSAITPKDEHSFLGTYVRDWYVTKFPEDPIGEELPFSLTFQDIADALPKGEVYDVMGDATDSVIRERVFAELADIYGVGYGVVYNAWVDKTPIQAQNKTQAKLPVKQQKPAQKPAVKQTSSKNTKPASKTIKFPFAKDLVIDGENVGKCTEIQEYANCYNFVTYNGVFQCRKNDKIAATGFDIKITTTK